jgi:glyoxalase family protein
MTTQWQAVPTTLPPRVAPIAALHHVTALARDPQRNLDFYTRTLGLRLVKLTVNFDDPGTYHFYFGNETGEPGTILTFFPWPTAKRGVQGAGAVVATAFNIPKGAIDFWRQRLEASADAANLRTFTRGGSRVLAFEDHDGMRLELVEASEGAAGWAREDIPSDVSLRGFHGVTLAVRRGEASIALLTESMGYVVVDREAEGGGTRTRLRAGGGGGGGFATNVDVLEDASLPDNKLGAGVVHHVAFRVPDLEAQAAWQQHLAHRGLRATPVQDRSYFHSIYFREPGQVLFEFATQSPGFATDETVEGLGGALKLPGQYEHARARIEQSVPRITLPGGAVVGRS